MKISKTRLKEIIKEELSGLGEGDEAGIPPHVRLQQVATSLGAGEDFVAMVREAITNAVSSEGMGWDRALGTMVDALEMLSPMQEADTPDEEEPEEDEEEPLVLGKDGPPSPEKIAQQRRQLKHGFKKWRK